MMKHVATTYRTMPQWEVFQKGFETLASSLASINSQSENSKKALTIGDLLVKASVSTLSLCTCTDDESADSTCLQVSAVVC